jgi:DNA-binding protein YbaB
MSPHVDQGQPGAALLREADRLASALDDYRHQLNNAPYTGSDEAGTVRATVTANLRITELIIDDSLPSLGSEVVAQRVTEALLNAQAAANQGRLDQAGSLLGALGLNAEVKQQFDAAVNELRKGAA